MPDLAPAEQEKLNEFQIISNFDEADYDKVIKLLQNNYWNLEIALSKYFDGQLDAEAERTPIPEEPTRSESIPPPEPASIPTPIIDNNWQQLNDPIALQNPLIDHSSFFRQLPLVRPISNKWRSHLGLLEKNLNNQPSIFNHFGSITENPLIFIILLIPRTITLILSAVSSIFNYIFPNSPNSVPDHPTLDSFSATEYFESLTQDKSQLQFFEGEFNDAFSIAKAENKYLLLILIGENELSKIFTKKILNNPQVQEFLTSKTDEIIIYLGNVNEPQSYEVAKTLKIRSSLPFISLIANVSNGPSGVSSMSLLSKIPSRTPSSFVSKLNKTIETFNPELLSNRLEQEELNYSRKLRELQDKAYQDSLNSDKQKQEAKKLEQELQETKLRHEEFIKQNKFRFYASLLQKLDNNTTTTDTITADSPKTRIRFKLPTGKLITQKFTKTSTIHDIYSFIDLQIHLDTLDEDELTKLKTYTDLDIHEDYKHEFKFELISPFPRIVIQRQDTDKEIGDVKELWPNGNLLVEFDDDDDDDEDN